MPKHENDDEEMASIDEIYAEIEKNSMNKLKEHAKHHTPQHMKMMMELMRKGKSFEESHEMALKKYPSPEKELEGMMFYDEKKAGWGMKKKAGMDEEKEASVEYVFMETELKEMVATISAGTGKTVIKISGVAFHEGMNKNRWEITKEGAQSIVDKMIGADLTLNHPPTKEKGVGFNRNMDGGVNDAVVGIVTEANFVEVKSGYEVHYVAEVRRPELFPALESGLWSRENYGVSIGGWGKPIAIAEDGKMTFGEDFTFDHLAIVHKPAYPRANIEKVEKIQPQSASEETKVLIYSSSDRQIQGETEMTDDIENMKNEMEELRSQLILANATIDDFNAQQAAAEEETRLSLVKKASEIGLKGHEDLSSETIENLIASWEASRPVKKEVVFAEATPAKDVAVEEKIVASEKESKPVVANYHNGELVKSDAGIYKRVWNALAKSYNSNFSSTDVEGRAYTFDEAVEKGFIAINE